MGKKTIDYLDSFPQAKVFIGGPTLWKTPARVNLEVINVQTDDEPPEEGKWGKCVKAMLSNPRHESTKAHHEVPLSQFGSELPASNIKS